MLQEIQRWSDDRLEAVHDFIQWLFPLAEPSPVNPSAPTLDRETIEAFAKDAGLTSALRVSLDRMLHFYGLEWREGAIRRSARFPQRAQNWLRPGNHNHYRITRILRSCSALGLGSEARAFLAALEEIALEFPRSITPITLRYWRGAG
jgi:hypothetical protein